MSSQVRSAPRKGAQRRQGDCGGELCPQGLQEDPDFLSRQLITYLGNKRSLLSPIEQAVQQVKARLGKPRLRLFDAFSGSGAVSRLFKAHAEYLAANDLEDYAALIARCYLTNRSQANLKQLAREAERLNGLVDRVDLPRGFIEELYAPRDERRIRRSDRVFYTRENARRLDNYRRLLDELSPAARELLLGPLLSRASVHANTSGVFKGFYKDRDTGVGRFGGAQQDALSRIRGRIELAPPVLSRFECEWEVFQGDAAQTAARLDRLDLVYLDPPYNQHPYGSNYFMLNLLVHYRRPQATSQVSGIPVDWRRSAYNVRAKALAEFRGLLTVLTGRTRFVLVSFSDEGFITPAQMHAALSQIGTVELTRLPYNTFRGSRNLRSRPLHVTEQLFLVQCHR